jgi:hypothetical protein
MVPEDPAEVRRVLLELVHEDTLDSALGGANPVSATFDVNAYLSVDPYLNGSGELY